jgi:hypothetical protein
MNQPLFFAKLRGRLSKWEFPQTLQQGYEIETFWQYNSLTPIAHWCLSVPYAFPYRHTMQTIKSSFGITSLLNA